VLGCFVTSYAYAQKGHELGGWIGSGIYFGDLNTNFNLKNAGPAAGLKARYNFDERISLKGILGYTYLKATDESSTNSYERTRNLNFHSHLFDLTGHIEFNFFPYIHGSKEYNYTPYLTGGFSVSKYNPKGTYFDPDSGQNITAALRNLGTEGQLPGEEYSLLSIGYSIGLGFKYDLSSTWSINAELITRQLASDYLDDVKGTYEDADLIDGYRPGLVGGTLPPSFFADPSIERIGDVGKQRGNSKDNDNYTIFSISIMKYFGTLQCPKPKTTSFY